MILEELVLHDFGVFGGRHQIPLAPPSPDKPIVLFGGMNGAGKTTILDALRLALYGKLAPCSTRGNLSYQEFLKRSVNRDADEGDGAGVELEFSRVLDGRAERVRVQRYWYCTPSGVRERVDVLVNGRSDRHLSETWDERVEDFLPARIASLCFFDGEKIEALADVESSAEVLATAVHALLGLEIVDKLRSDLQILERNERIAAKEEGEQEGLRSLQAAITELEEERRRIRDEAAHIRTHVIDRRQKELADLERRYRASGGERLERQGELERSKEDLDGRRREVEEELRGLASGHLPLILVDELLRRSCDQAAAEEEAKRQEAILAEVAARDADILSMIAEHGMDPEGIAAVRSRLGEDRDARRTRAALERHLDLDEGVRSQVQYLRNGGLAEAVERTSASLDAWAALERDAVALERALDFLPDQATVADLRAQRAAAREALERGEAQLAHLNEQLDQIERELQRASAAFHRALGDEARALQDQQDRQRLVAHAQRAQGTLSAFRARVLEKNIRRIEAAVLEGFQHLLRKQDFVRSLRIDPETFRITLTGADGTPLDPSRLSAGERQLLAVSILWGLARVAGRPLPVVIDTPLGRLDSTHRGNLVQRYFPAASHQVLLLSTDEEIDQELARCLKPSLGRSYTLTYVDSDRRTSITEGYLWSLAS